MFSTEVLLWVVTFLNLALTSCALWAAITARSSLKALRLKLAERSTRSLAAVDAAMRELESTVSSLSRTMKRISSRLGMQDVRARRTQELDLTGPLTKQQLRKALASGQLRVLSDEAAAARRSNGATHTVPSQSSSEDSDE